MEKVPITFYYNGKAYTGNFEPVKGAAHVNVWYLMIDKFYYGRLRLTTDNDWFFDGNQMTELAGYFGCYVMAWYE